MKLFSWSKQKNGCTDRQTNGHLPQQNNITRGDCGINVAGPCLTVKH